MKFRRMLPIRNELAAIVVAASLSPIAGLYAQDADDPLAPAVSESDALRRNLEATISEGEKTLRSLPRDRLSIIRSRISNLERQLKRKEKERKQLQESLAILRADFYRRLAAIKQNEGVAEDRFLRKQETKLRDDYDLHAESFEEELKALNQDIVEIRKTIDELRSQSAIAESLRPAPQLKPEDLEPQASDRVLEIPRRLDPFMLNSFVPRARGKKTAHRTILWGLKGEIAFRSGDLDTAKSYWQEVLETASDDGIERSARYNLAYTDYMEGNFSRCYQSFSELFDESELESLSAQDAYTMAVLSYLNGVVDDARIYLRLTDAERRRRMEAVLGPIAVAEI